MVENAYAQGFLTKLKPMSVSAVITAPPPHYGETAIPLSVVSAVSRIHQMLKPGGALAVIANGETSTAWDAVARERLQFMAEIAVLWDGASTARDRVHQAQVGFDSLFTLVRWYCKPGGQYLFNAPDDNRRIESNVLVAPFIPYAERLHPDEIPLGVTNFLVTLLTREGDLVVDPYCGSGGTLVSAVMAGRDYAGCDIDPEYAAMTKRRIEHHELEHADPIYIWMNGQMREI